MVMLDLGANTECDARNLVQFAIMGAAYARIVTGTRHAARAPAQHRHRGNQGHRRAAGSRPAAARRRPAWRSASKAIVEADKINRGNVDVVVADGFSGNIALKAIEGSARFVTDLLKNAFRSSLRSKFGFLVSRPATELLRHHLDPNNHNGAVFLGLNGVVVKSHGSANAAGRRQCGRGRRAAARGKPDRTHCRRPRRARRGHACARTARSGRRR